MEYNIYTASTGKKLIDLDDFMCANEFRTKHILNVVEVSPEDATYFSIKYQEEKTVAETNAQETDITEELIEEQPVLLKSAKGLRAATTEPIDSVQRLKNLLKEELVFKGYNLNNLVEPTIHNSK